MPAKVIWASSGLSDLESALGYIARDRPAAALRWGEAVIARTRQLGDFPRLGKRFAVSSGGEVRETVIPPYRLFYRVSPDEQLVTLLRVWHGARGEPPAFGSA